METWNEQENHKNKSLYSSMLVKKIKIKNKEKEKRGRSVQPVVGSLPAVTAAEAPPLR